MTGSSAKTATRIGATSISRPTLRGRANLGRDWGRAKLAGREENVRRRVARDVPRLGQVGRRIGQLAERGGFGSTL